MKAFRFTEHRINALIALARFEYLTTDQFLRLGVSSSESNLSNRVLRPLKAVSPKLIEHYNQGQERGAWGLYYLTRHGAEFAAAEMERPLKSVRWPKSKLKNDKPFRDFEHRRGTIWCIIELYLYCQKHRLTLDFVRTYYQGTGAQRGKIKFTSDTLGRLRDGTDIEPDLLFRFTTKDDESRLFALEFHRGNDLGRITEQLALNAQAIEDEVFSDRFDHPNYNFVLSVYEDERTLKNALKRLRTMPDFEPFAPGFAFCSLDILKDDFAKAWLRLDGSPYPLF